MALIPCEVSGVFVAAVEEATAPLVMLTDNSGRRVPVFIGIWEAISINSALKGEHLPRPFTHDLFIDIFSRFSISLTSVRIDTVEDGVYYAQLVMNDETGEELVDCRPSDGIAIALRAGAPVFVEESIFSGLMTSTTEEIEKLVELTTFMQK